MHQSYYINEAKYLENFSSNEPYIINTASLYVILLECNIIVTLLVE